VIMNENIMESRIKQWLPILEEQASSGLSKHKWCEANGINVSTFFKWQGKIREYMLKDNTKMPNSKKRYFQAEPCFVDITPKPSQAVAKNAPTPESVLLKTPSISKVRIKYEKFSIEIDQDVDERLLAMALRVISDVK
jgi:hypothetical protein